MLFLKKITDDAKKTKRLTGIFHMLQNQIYVFKKNKVTQLVKPINY